MKIYILIPVIRKSNIKITNKKEPYVKIRKNDKWELQDKKKALATLVDDKYYILVDHYADVEKTIIYHIKQKNNGTISR